MSSCINNFIHFQCFLQIHIGCLLLLFWLYLLWFTPFCPIWFFPFFNFYIFDLVYFPENFCFIFFVSNSSLQFAFTQCWWPYSEPLGRFIPHAYFSTPCWFLTGGHGPDLSARWLMQHEFWLHLFIIVSLIMFLVFHQLVFLLWHLH